MAGEAVLSIELSNVQGGTLRLSELQGKVVLVNFWAMWCPPCREEIPDLVEVQESYAHRGFTVVGVDYMEALDLDRLKGYMAKMKINYPIVYGSQEKTQRLARGLGPVHGLPTSILLDRQGKVVFSRVGGLKASQLKRLIEPLLAAPARVSER